MRILLITKDKKLSSLLLPALCRSGYIVTAAEAVSEALDEAFSGIYGAALLSLPEDESGELLHRLRSEGSSLHVVLLTSQGAQARIAALNSGADCCLALPIEPEELFAQLRSLFRRRTEAVCPAPAFGDLVLDLRAAALQCLGSEIRLSATELELMRLLLINGEAIVSKESLLVKVWGYNAEVESSIVETYISFLRKKLKKVNSSVTIETLWRRGYRLKCAEAPV